MLIFKKLELQDITLFNAYINQLKPITCDYSFTNLFIWREYYNVKICLMNGLYIQITTPKDKKTMFYPPIATDFNKAIVNLKEYCHDVDLVFTCIEPKQLLQIQDLMQEKYVYELIRDNADYIYLTEDLQSLSGKPLKTKRNLVNQFINHYDDQYSYESLTKDNASQIIDFLEIWYEENTTEDSTSFLHEKEAIHELLIHQEVLKTKGGLLKINNKLIAFCLGTIQNDTMITHIEKALYDITGSYQMINHLFANMDCKNVTYINREEDMGSKGLRQAKKSYNPILLGINYNAYPRNSITFSQAGDEDLESLKNLWYETFDNNHFTDWYFSTIYNKNETYILKIASRVICMARVMFITHDSKAYCYLYGLSTTPSLQKQGLMKLLLNNTQERQELANISTTILIPESSDLIAFYEHLGYRSAILGLSTVISKSDIQTNKTIKELCIDDAQAINKLYKKHYPNSLNRDSSYYSTLFSQLTANKDKAVGLISGNELIGYAYLFCDENLIQEIVVENESLMREFVSIISSMINASQIKVINSFTGNPVYYCYKGPIQKDFYINMLFN